MEVFGILTDERDSKTAIAVDLADHTEAVRLSGFAVLPNTVSLANMPEYPQDLTLNLLKLFNEGKGKMLNSNSAQSLDCRRKQLFHSCREWVGGISNWTQENMANALHIFWPQP
jgi:hypothetical protein